MIRLDEKGELRYGLLSEGTSDSVLKPLIDWVLAQHYPRVDLEGNSLNKRLSLKGLALAKKLELAIQTVDVDVLFVHRDADRTRVAKRETEIFQAWEMAIKQATLEDSGSKVIPIVPVTMSESWLLIDEQSIKLAANNPKSKIGLSLPSPANIERIADPKAKLFECLKAASELKGRRLKKFRPEKQRHLIPHEFSDQVFNRLLQVPSFQHFYDSIPQYLNP